MLRPLIWPEPTASPVCTRFLVRVLQLSPGEAASRVRAAAAVGPRQSMLGEKLQPVLPRLAGLQRDGDVSVEKVQIVTQAMHKLLPCADSNPELSRHR